MEKFLPFFLDLAAVLFVIGYIRSAARRGFVRTVVQLIGFFISLFLANTLSGVAAEYTFSHFIQQGLTDKISEQIVSSGSADGFLADAGGSAGKYSLLFAQRAGICRTGRRI